MMIKYFQILIIISLSSSLWAEKPKVVVSNSILADMTYNIAGDKVTIESIVPIGGDPHLHEPTPRDAKLVSAADLVFINGLTFEGWFSKLAQNNKSKVLTVTNGIDTLASLEYQNAADPHAWMDASNASLYLENITQGLIRVLPSESAFFLENQKKYQAKIDELDEYILAAIQKIPAQSRVLVTSHDAFQYYGKRYGLELASVQGISTEAEAQTADMARLQKLLQERPIPAIFVESTISPKLMQQIAKDNKVKIGGELFADSLGKRGSQADTYIKMLRHNTDVILAGLSTGETLDNEDETSSSNTSSLFWIGGFVALLLIGGFLVVARKLS